MIVINGKTIVHPTIFPDKTSQVWKLDNQHLQYVGELRVIWEFENEAELIHLSQLKMLLDNINPKALKVLEIPYLPYARQDKQVSNRTTFALTPFARLLNTMEWDAVLVFDPHSKIDDLIKNVVSIQPSKEIEAAIGECQPDLIVYPDAGAQDRYFRLINIQSICLEKTRNQLTGEITGMKVEDFYAGQSLIGKTCLMVDDLVDGGATFVGASILLHSLGAKEVDLYVSHGIFSKGLSPLRNSGIKRIFTKNGEVA